MCVHTMYMYMYETLNLQSHTHTHTHTHTPQSQGLHLPTGEDDDTQQRPQLDPEEKEKLMKQIEELKEEIASMKSGSLLGDQQPKDILREYQLVDS